MEFQYESNRIFLTDDSGKEVAVVSFPEIEKGIVDINRTFVDDSLRGQGVAGKLMKAAAEKIRADGLKARISCSYAVRWFDSHPEEGDILAR